MAEERADMISRESLDFIRTADEKDVDTLLCNSFAHYYSSGLVRGFLTGLVASTLFWLVVVAIKYILKT